MPIISREIFIEFSYQFLRSLPILTEIISYVNQHRATSHKEEVPDRAMVTKDEIIYNLLICHNYASTISESIFRSELPIDTIQNHCREQFAVLAEGILQIIFIAVNIYSIFTDIPKQSPIKPHQPATISQTSDYQPRAMRQPHVHSNAKTPIKAYSSSNA